MQATMRGGSLDGQTREVRGIFVEGPTLLREDGTYREMWSWQEDPDGTIYGLFEGLFKRRFAGHRKTGSAYEWDLVDG